MHADSRGTLPPAFPRSGKAKALALLFCGLAPLCVGIIALALGQDANWDHRNYHWYNGFAAWHGLLLFDLLPSQLPFFYSPYLDIPYYLAGSVLPPKLTAFLVGAIQGLNAVLLFLIAYTTLRSPNETRKSLACAGLAALGVWGGGGFALIGTNFYDNIISLGLFTSLLLTLRWLPVLLATTTARAVVLAALCGVPAGLFAGFKLPHALYGIAMGAAFLGTGGRWPRRLLLGFGFGAGCLAGFALSYGPWGVFLFSHYDSPVFPYFNDVFQSGFAPPSSTRDTKFLPGAAADALLFPYIFSLTPTRVGEIFWQDFRIPVLYTLLPLALVLRALCGPKKQAEDPVAPREALRYLFWFAALSYGLWLGLFAIYRYLVPLEMLAPLLIGLAIGILPIKAQRRTLWTLVVLAGIALTVQPGTWGRADRWLDSPAPVTLPELGPTDKLMILMAGQEPYAHVRPAFPKTVPFVRIQSNLISPEQGYGLNGLIRARIEAHKKEKGRFLLLIPAWDFETAASALRVFGLAFKPQTCKDVIDHLYPSKLKLCPLLVR